MGASLALACDVVLASDMGYFMLAFTKIGLVPDGGASALVAAAVGRIRAMRMALLAGKIHAEEAFQAGLVTAVYPADEFDAATDNVVATLMRGPVLALAKTKDAINATTLAELEAALARDHAGNGAPPTSPTPDCPAEQTQNRIVWPVFVRVCVCSPEKNSVDVTVSGQRPSIV